MHHHYYRYLVVSPGGGRRYLNSGSGMNNSLVDPFETDEEDEAVDVNNNNNKGGDDTNMIISTSNEQVGSTAVVQWEDPFGTLLKSHNRNSIVAASSNLSLTSSVGQSAHFTKLDYRNLRYRTCDVDIPKLLQLNTSINSTSSDAPTTVTLDYYGNPDDVTFRPYLIREAVSDCYISC